jgi:chromosome segregation ATPase
MATIAELLDEMEDVGEEDAAESENGEMESEMEDLRQQLADERKLRMALRVTLSEEVRKSDMLITEIATLKNAITSALTAKAEADDMQEKMDEERGMNASKMQDMDMQMKQHCQHIAELQNQLAEEKGARIAAESALRSEQSARIEAEKRTTAAMIPAQREAMTLPPPPTYALDVVERDGNNRIRQLRLRPV